MAIKVSNAKLHERRRNSTTNRLKIRLEQATNCHDRLSILSQHLDDPSSEPKEVDVSSDSDLEISLLEVKLMNDRISSTREMQIRMRNLYGTRIGELEQQIEGLYAKIGSNKFENEGLDTKIEHTGDLIQIL